MFWQLSLLSFFIALFIYFWLCWVFVVVSGGLPCGTQVSPCGGLSCCEARALGHSGFISCGSQALEHTLSSCGCPAACGIFLDQESDLYLLHWQADSSQLSPQGSPEVILDLLECCRETRDFLCIPHLVLLSQLWYLWVCCCYLFRFSFKFFKNSFHFCLFIYFCCVMKLVGS